MAQTTFRRILLTLVTLAYATSPVVCREFDHTKPCFTLWRRNIDPVFLEQRNELRDLGKIMLDMCTTSIDYTNNYEHLKMFRDLKLTSDLIYKETAFYETNAELITGYERLHQELNSYTAAVSQVPFNPQTVESAHDSAEHALQNFLLHYKGDVTRKITNAGVLQRTVLLACVQAAWHLMYQKYAYTSPEEKKLLSPSTGIKDRLARALPGTLLTTSRIGARWLVDELAPCADGTAKQRWFELIASYIGGYLVARGVSDTTEGFASSHLIAGTTDLFLKDSIAGDILASLTATRFYLKPGSKLYKLADLWGYLYIFKGLLLSPERSGNLVRYEALDSYLIKLAKSDIGKGALSILTTNFLGYVQKKIDWPSFVHSKPRRRALIYLLAITIGFIQAGIMPEKKAA